MPSNKGGKPSSGTPADMRLAVNRKPKKPAFPGAAKPFPKKPKK